ncbi:MAG TPA: GMC family oxidoreductase [Caulobacteraceae bacterium]|nr:GMC family oxidoreductase [Caulobacteraceae bacterium]
MAIAPWSEITEPADLCIVGAGPVGLAVALACARGGLTVLVLEAGGPRGAPPRVDPAAFHIEDPARHAPVEAAMARGLGGASLWWGGRCVPLDDIDFAPQASASEAAWPIDHAQVRPWYEPAWRFLGSGPALFEHPAPGWEAGGDVRFDTLERWAPKPKLGARYRGEVERTPNLRLVLGATAVGLEVEGDGVAGIEAVGAGGARAIVRARRYVIAAGGLETTRLLLMAQRRTPRLFGGPDGALGRYYAGHVSGKIADVELAAPGDAAALDFFLDGPSYARRRFTLSAPAQRREGLLNAAFWIDNPPLHDPDHRSALLSAVWMALAFEPLGSRLLPEAVRRLHVGSGRDVLTGHLRNLLAGAPDAAVNLARMFGGRYLASPARPGFLLRRRSGRYALHYHAEQSPNRSSRVSICAAGETGARERLKVSLRYQPADIASVLRSHELLDGALRRSGKGRLIYRAPPAEREARVWAQAGDGFHQTGTTRMGRARRDSVVDGDCRIHDLDNLYLASSSVFPRAGQANPTLPAVALGLRLADRLLREGPGARAR